MGLEGKEVGAPQQAGSGKQRGSCLMTTSVPFTGSATRPTDGGGLGLTVWAVQVWTSLEGNEGGASSR